MTTPDRRFRRWLQEHAGSPEPSSAEMSDARDTLRRAMVRASRRRAWTGPRRWVAAVAAIAVLALVVVVVRPAVTDRAEGALIELARATRALPPEQLPTGSYIYLHREQQVLVGTQIDPSDDGIQITYLLPSTIDEWWQGDTVLRTVTTGPPVFFDADSEVRYYEAGLDEADGVGETLTETFTGVEDDVGRVEWSSDPDVLADQIAAADADSTSPLPDTVRAFQLAPQILAGQRQPSPDLRAAVIEYLSQLPLDVTGADDGSVTVSITYTDAVGTLTETLELSPTGFVTGRRLVLDRPDQEGPIPAGTALEDTRWALPQVVPEPGVIP